MANRLENETSPYLLQHANNPVEWFAWNEDALRLARERNKPILLSVGYSACHWCHVMAHESFEDPQTAELMNELFVNIKVDREERPDIDKIYQSAHQLIARAPGGWPLTVFLTPDEHLPIFTGTYFPTAQFREVLRRVEAYFRTHAGEIHDHGTALRSALRSLQTPERYRDDLTAAPIALARARLGESFDGEYGGFGGAPKFPHPTHIDTLLSAWRASTEQKPPDRQALYMATLTLTRMASGGLYDHLGGGFFRYSVDRYWAIPHFEKMLYDNAALLMVYADAFAATGEALFGRVASDTADWVMGEMQDAHGGYYSTLDADSEGEEGKYYLWTPEALATILDEDERSVAMAYFGVDGEANFEAKAWHLHAARPMEALGEASGDAGKSRERLESARRKLLAARATRVAPARDEKVLASWNGLMVKGMARAARHLRRQDLAAAASRAADFMRTRMWDGERLKASYKGGRARFTAYLDDYAFVADGLLELLRCRWRTSDLAFAQALAEVLLTQFQDPQGGFFFTANDHEALIHRPKPFSDEATPAGNGIAVQVLLQLGHLLGEPRYIESAERALRAAWPALERYPEAHGTMLAGLESLLSPPEVIIIRGDPGISGEWQAYVDGGYHPGRLSFCIPNHATGLPGLLAERRPRGDVVAYLCKGTECREPVTRLEALAAALRASTA